MIIRGSHKISRRTGVSTGRAKKPLDERRIAGCNHCGKTYQLVRDGLSAITVLKKR